MSAADTTETSQERQATIGYQVKGSGSNTLVLLRGLGRWSDHWLGFDDVLAARGYRVITIDNRGFGKSRQIPVGKGAEIRLFAEDAASVIAREAPYGAHVIGTSLGGMIGLALAATRPQLIRSLTIINSSVAASGKRRLSARGVMALAHVALGLNKGYMRLAHSLLGKNSPQELRGQLAAKWSAIDVVTPLTLKTVMRQISAARKFKGLVEAAAIRCPVMVVKSESDLFVDPANSDFIHRQIKGATLVSHPSAGHEITFEAPDWLSSEIDRFVAHGSAG
jgi:pimeloyl-ACP methyl ester carboxylesterase